MLTLANRLLAGGGNTIETFSVSTAMISNTALASYTFTSVNFGAEPTGGSRRFIAVAVSTACNSRPTTLITSVTIAGSTATVVANLGVNFGSSSKYGSGVFYLEVPTGTSGTIVINLGATGIRIAAQAYIIETGAAGIAARDSGTDSTANDPTVLLDVDADNPVIAACGTYQYTGGTWDSGMTLDAQTTGTSALYMTASGQPSVADASFNVGVATGGTASASCMAAAAFEPA